MAANDRMTFTNATPQDFAATLKQYPEYVPDKLRELDEKRYVSIPATITSEWGSPRLSKDAVVSLVEWKLSHGKVRPTLRALAQQNDEDVVGDVTKEGFATFSGGTTYARYVESALKILTKLRGIGPATASLLLSVYEPEYAPFFSDELFRWCMSEDGRGWDREIKYTIKEYLELFARVETFQQRFKEDFGEKVSAVDMEKVAYVLGKQAAGQSTNTDGTSAGTGSKRKATALEPGPESQKVKKAVNTSTTKSKAANTTSHDKKSKPSPQPTRRSNRPRK